MNENIRQKMSNALRPWTPFSETRGAKILLGPTVPRSAASKIKLAQGLAESDWQPPVDIVECEDEFIIKVELPGLRQDQVRVKLDGGIISISGQRDPEKDGQTFHRVERQRGAFTRNFAVPESIVREKVTAGYKNGLLKVHLPKDPAGKTRLINVVFEPVAR